MLPNQLYQFASPKDSTGGRLEVVNTRFLVDSAANVLVTGRVFRIPGDRVFQLNGFLAAATAGAAQNALLVRVQIVDELGNAQGNFALGRQAGGTNLDVFGQVRIWIPPQFGLQAVASFDAGAVANFLSFSVTGVLFPRGNVQIGSLAIE